MMLLSSYLLLCSVLSTLASASKCSPSGVVDLGYAKHVPTYFNITDSGNNVTVYKNIRFGNPTGGNARFRKPDTNLPRQPNIQDGKVPLSSNACIASVPSFVPYPGINGTTWGTEDCLFLDVYVPKGVKPDDKVPVLHLFFGSAYAFLDKDQYSFFNPIGLFDGSAEENKIIFVVNNYRLGMPGWTSVPGLDMDANVGLYDCLAAAQWTSKYISRFGGDPDRVTVMGQSAGAGMIELMTVLNGGEGKLPFQQAFASSPGITARRNSSATTARRQDMFQAVLTATNCTDLNCVRSVPESVMMKANEILLETVGDSGGGVLGPGMGFGPVPDESLPDLPVVMFQQGKYHKELKGLLVGNMALEGLTTSDGSDMPDGFPSMVRGILTSASNETIAGLQAMYTDLAEPAQLAWDWTTDVIFACNAYNLANAFNNRARRYIMSIPPAFHGMDISYYLYVNQDLTPVSNPELVPMLQGGLLKFVHGMELDWPIYGQRMEIYNITSEGYMKEPLPENLRGRCDAISKALSNPANGV